MDNGIKDIPEPGYNLILKNSRCNAQVFWFKYFPTGGPPQQII